MTHGNNSHPWRSWAIADRHVAMIVWSRLARNIDSMRPNMIGATFFGSTLGTRSMSPVKLAEPSIEGTEVIYRCEAGACAMSPPSHAHNVNSIRTEGDGEREFGGVHRPVPLW